MKKISVVISGGRMKQKDVEALKKILDEQSNSKDTNAP